MKQEQLNYDESQEFRLRPYQLGAVKASLQALRERKNALLIMATGTGKTIVFASIIGKLCGGSLNSLVVAHRRELIDQALSKIRGVTGIQGSREQASDHSSATEKVVVASIQSIRNRLDKYEPKHFRLVTVDEAHHAVAPSYESTLDYFTGANVLGVTATPDRADDRSLSKRFETIAYSYTLGKAITDGYLARIVGRRVQDFTINLSDLRIQRGDFVDSELAERILEYVGEIARSVKDETHDKKTLLFLPTVESARIMAEALCKLGLSAESVSGNDSIANRQTTLYRFSQGITTHLCSVALLLEGYDEPSIDAIVMLRPTGSRALYSQAIGRGTRLFPGKQNLLLVEFTFNSERHNLVSPYELFADFGFGDRVRQRATTIKDGDFLETLELAHNEHYKLDALLDRLVLGGSKKYNFQQFDPFGLADMLSVDLSGEMVVEYQGRKLEGAVSSKQRELLSRYGLTEMDAIDKGQASQIIDKLFTNGHMPMLGMWTSKQKNLLKKLGCTFDKPLLKAQASMMIDQIMKKKEVTF